MYKHQEPTRTHIPHVFNIAPSKFACFFFKRNEMTLYIDLKLIHSGSSQVIQKNHHHIWIKHYVCSMMGSRKCTCNQNIGHIWVSQMAVVCICSLTFEHCEKFVKTKSQPDFMWEKISESNCDFFPGLHDSSADEKSPVHLQPHFVYSIQWANTHSYSATNVKKWHPTRIDKWNNIRAYSKLEYVRKT